MTKLTRRQSSGQLAPHLLRDRVIQQLLAAEKALGVAVGIDQVKLVMDVAAAQEVLAKRQKLGEDVIGYAHTIKMRALTRLGELIEAAQEVGAIAKRGKPAKSSEAELLRNLQISRKTSMVAKQLASLPHETREAIAQRETTIAQARRERKAVEIRKVVSLPDAKYRVIYADPPWSYNDKADAGSVQSGGAEMHYPSMSISDLCALPVPEVVESNAVLFLWVTSPLLFECAPVIKAWGFTYKASFVWDKVKHNMGHYNSVRHEFLLICTKGSCTPDVVELFDSVQSIERTTHSTKPEEFRRMIETLYPHGKKLELFARRQADGWDSFGNQAQAEAV
jgi:N6-adenosine-specific RNA methylase IME4